MAGVDLLFGPMLLGVVVNMMLYGVMVTQTFTYFQRYTHDLAWIRYFILYLFVVETAVVVIEVGIIYQPLITEYGTIAAVLFYPKLLPGDSLLITLVSAPIQFFTAWRIKVITGRYIIPAFICLLSVVSFSGGIVVSAMVSTNSRFRDFDKFKPEVIVWLIFSAACDILVAIGMVHALYTRKTGFKKVDGQINRIVRLTIETGSATAIMALLDVFFFIGAPHTGLNFVVDFPLSTIYTCSILAMLNSREPRSALTDAERGTGGSGHTLSSEATYVANPKPPRKISLKRSKSNTSVSKLEVFTTTEKIVETAPRDDVSERSLALYPAEQQPVVLSKLRIPESKRTHESYGSTSTDTLDEITRGFRASEQSFAVQTPIPTPLPPPPRPYSPWQSQAPSPSQTPTSESRGRPTSRSTPVMARAKTPPFPVAAAGSRALLVPPGLQGGRRPLPSPGSARTSRASSPAPTPPPAAVSQAVTHMLSPQPNPKAQSSGSDPLSSTQKRARSESRPRQRPRIRTLSDSEGRSQSRRRAQKVRFEEAADFGVALGSNSSASSISISDSDTSTTAADAYNHNDARGRHVHAVRPAILRSRPSSPVANRSAPTKF